MTDNCAQELESIGFEWSVMIAASATRWDSMFQELQSYKTEHGHCNIPTASGTLGCWVSNQRQQYRLVKEGKPSSTTDERVQKLESIGFQWSVIKIPRNISAMQPPFTANDVPRVCKSGRIYSLLARSSIFFTYFNFLMAVLGLCIFVTITIDDAYCKDPDTSSTDSQMDYLQDACGVSLYEPTIVESSAAASKEAPVFRPFF